MWQTLVVLLGLISILYGNGDDRLELNLQAAHVKDVNVISHVPVARQLTIVMNSERLCKEPIFKVRLSGTSLYILDRIHHNHANKSSIPDTYRFSYPPIIDVGTYFLEVVLLACEYVKPDGFADQCLESPIDGKNVLSMPYSFKVDSHQVVTATRPRWVLDKGNEPALLPTRYQRVPCRGWCAQPESPQHNLYSWVDKPAYLPLLNKTFELGLSTIAHPTGTEKITFCMIGASHARHLTEQGNELKIARVAFVHIDSRFPLEFDANYLSNCSYAIIGYGQWPLSITLAVFRASYSADVFGAEMRTVFDRLHRANSPAQAYVRSMNYNALGSRYTSCPAQDHRRPPLIDMYNHVMRNVSAAYNVEYIDTVHVQAPLWDAAADWNHCPARVFVAEIEFIMHHVFSRSLKHHRAPSLFSTEEVPPTGLRNVAGKFSDSEVVYLLAGDLLRAFPDWNTFTALGFVPPDIVIWNATLREDFKIGPILHNIHVA